MLLRQIDLFYKNDCNIQKNNYKIGDKVFLKKGTFLHGIFGELENFNYTLDNGFISVDFTLEPRANKICNSVGMWNTQFDEEILKLFLDSRYYNKFLEKRFNKNASTTDRESAIMFGLPSTLIEGVFVGRKIENDKKAIEYIKSKLPDCYICNLDGKVIVQ